MHVYHRSHHVFNFPSIDEIERNLTGSMNGLLGLWVTFKDEDWAKGFGDILYSMDVDLRKNTVRHLKVGDLSKMGLDPEPYREFRAKLLAEGVDFLYLLEGSGESHMGIVINFEAISNFRRVREPWRPNDKQQPANQVKAHPV